MRLFTSTRNDELSATASAAVLNGIAPDGGLYMFKDFEQLQIDLGTICSMDYFSMAELILGKLLDDYDEGEIKHCVHAAYADKFASEAITPLVEVGDVHLLELFHGPTSAFKDVALSILPYLVTTALKKQGIEDEIIILTATSGDTGKAALAGFKDVAGTKIMVFYPDEGVSAVQQLQMVSQEGKNVCVAAIKGNFDDAQTAVKKIFTDHELAAKMKADHQQFSSANSINIGRLTPQIVYYFKAYSDLVKNGKECLGDPVNFVVPTGNFGNILAGYLAKQMGLPIAKLVCASNENNVLTEFIQRAIYDCHREFKKTLSPSMDILVSSNLERLIYLLAEDTGYVKKLMEALNREGKFAVNERVMAGLKHDFWASYANDSMTKQAIHECYEQHHYVMDTHTAVAYAAAMDFKKAQVNDFPIVVLSTASPYKFAGSVYEAITGKQENDEFKAMELLHELSGVKIPAPLAALSGKPVLHDHHIQREEIKAFVEQKLGEKQW